MMTWKLLGIGVLTAVPFFAGSAETLSPVKPARAEAEGQKRIRFQIDMVEKNGGATRPISNAVVEGPPGLDFNITLNTMHYNLEAKFLTDMEGRNAVNVRANLVTRRMLGYSRKGLPMYEEDRCGQTLEVGFDEQMVLFPFGQIGEANLEIDIAPVLTTNDIYEPSGAKVPLQIAFIRKVEGVIHIEAMKTPHRFQVEATLVEDGRDIARGVSQVVLQQKQELALTRVYGSPPGSGQPLPEVALSVDRYERGCPTGSAAFSFDIYGPGAEAEGRKNRPLVASDWAGIGQLGADSVYNLADTSLAVPGRRRELRLKIAPATGETGY
jgi:hypothetical protein